MVLNDEEWNFPIFQQIGVEITLIILLKIIYPYFPDVLTKFIAADLCTKGGLSSINTCFLEKGFAAGVHNITLKT